MSSFLSNSVLLAIYGGALAVGLALIGLAVVSLLRSFTPGRQASSDGRGRRLNRALAYSLGLGAAVLGAVGLLALLVFRLSPLPSVWWALGAGLVAGALAEIILVYLPNRRRVEEATIAIDADGREARVVIPIPASGLGEVTYQDGAETIHLGARSATGQPIGRDSRVRIERVSRRVAIVRPVGGPVGGER
jgi:membrane protein implicated in regulation of membrane protease activity